MNTITIGNSCYDSGTSTSTDDGSYYIPDPCCQRWTWYQWKLWMSCPKCGKCIECGDRYCRHCGEQMFKVCPHCGKEI